MDGGFWRIFEGCDGITQDVRSRANTILLEVLPEAGQWRFFGSEENFSPLTDLLISMGVAGDRLALNDWACTQVDVAKITLLFLEGDAFIELLLMNPEPGQQTWLWDTFIHHEDALYPLSPKGGERILDCVLKKTTIQYEKVVVSLSEFIALAIVKMRRRVGSSALPKELGAYHKGC